MKATLLALLLSAVAATQSVKYESIDQLRALAVQGDPEAQNDLGSMYSEGRGLPVDYVEAFNWYSKSAAKGDFLAEFNLGFAYSSGRGVPQDYHQAAYWLREAADHGEPKAMMLLASLYRLGRGVPRDYVKAHMWANLATARVSGEAQSDFASLRDEIATHLKPDELFAAQILASRWRPVNR